MKPPAIDLAPTPALPEPHRPASTPIRPLISENTSNPPPAPTSRNTAAPSSISRPHGLAISHPPSGPQVYHHSMPQFPAPRYPASTRSAQQVIASTTRPANSYYPYSNGPILLPRLPQLENIGPAPQHWNQPRTPTLNSTPNISTAAFFPSSVRNTPAYHSNTPASSKATSDPTPSPATLLRTFFPGNHLPLPQTNARELSPRYPSTQDAPVRALQPPFEPSFPNQPSQPPNSSIFASHLRHEHVHQLNHLETSPAAIDDQLLFSSVLDHVFKLIRAL
ncbi:hypothetical protein C8R46DRAFT_1063386, partial [Mycena filopes]